MSRRRVHLPGGSGYDVIVEPGLLDRLGSEVASALPRVRRWVLIADDTVAALHGDRALASLPAAGGGAVLIRFPAGEANKTRETWARLTDELLARGIGRDAGIIALGGGVTGDLAGFVAATYMRGLPVVQVPTTLLAMVDASVGGKTGVDTPYGKNLIGAFHPPAAVLADPGTLRTLQPRELRSGLAEAVKHGAIRDPAYLEAIVEQGEALLDCDAGRLADVVSRSVEIKAEVVEADPLEAGERAILNFGHTIGHALELACAYTLPHGEAVAVGMYLEARLGEALGITSPGSADELAAALERLGLPTRLPAGVDPDALVAGTGLDKKARAGGARYVLLSRVGRVARAMDGGWTHAVEAAVVGEVLRGGKGS